MLVFCFAYDTNLPLILSVLLQHEAIFQGSENLENNNHQHKTSAQSQILFLQGFIWPFAEEAMMTDITGLCYFNWAFC